MTTEARSTVHLPRVEIKFCVQCKWNLRAAYYAQELLQTFSNTIGEIALVPVTGGIFTITLTTSISTSTLSDIETVQIWDRKTDGGFPETKELKNRIRNVIDPAKDMGHIDRVLKKGKTEAKTDEQAQGGGETQSVAGKATAEGGEREVITSGDNGNVGTTSEQNSTEKAKHSHASDKGGKIPMEDCEDCRLAATESLEQEIAKVVSG